MPCASYMNLANTRTPDPPSAQSMIQITPQPRSQLVPASPSGSAVNPQPPQSRPYHQLLPAMPDSDTTTLEGVFTDPYTYGVSPTAATLMFDSPGVTGFHAPGELETSLLDVYSPSHEATGTLEGWDWEATLFNLTYPPAGDDSVDRFFDQGFLPP